MSERCAPAAPPRRNGGWAGLRLSRNALRHFHSGIEPFQGFAAPFLIQLPGLAKMPAMGLRGRRGPAKRTGTARRPRFRCSKAPCSVQARIEPFQRFAAPFSGNSTRPPDARDACTRYAAAARGATSSSRRHHGCSPRVEAPLPSCRLPWYVRRGVRLVEHTMNKPVVARQNRVPCAPIQRWVSALEPPGQGHVWLDQRPKGSTTLIPALSKLARLEVTRMISRVSAVSGDRFPDRFPVTVRFTPLPASLGPPLAWGPRFKGVGGGGRSGLPARPRRRPSRPAGRRSCLCVRRAVAASSSSASRRSAKGEKRLRAETRRQRGRRRLNLVAKAHDFRMAVVSAPPTV